MPRTRISAAANSTASDDKWPSLSDLPENTAREIGSTSNGIRAVVKREQAKKTGAARYIVFSNVPPKIVEESNECASLVGGGNVRIFYDEAIRHLIVKLVSGPHEVAERMLSRKFEQAAEHMGLEDDLVPTGSKRIKSIPHSNEPDSSWRPEILPTGRTNKWPAVVIESGFSESLRRLRLDAQWWITSSRGDKWILDPNAGTLRPRASIRSSRVSGIRPQEITMTRGPNNVVTTTGAPLIVTFDEMFLRTANPPQEFNIIVPEQALERIAHKIWMEQGI